MLVRLIGVTELIIGVLVASAKLQLLAVHMGLGFLLAVCLLLLAILALSARKVGIGIVGLLFAIGIPISGIKQFPLKFGNQLGLVQIVHVVVVLIAIGVAEALNGTIQRSAH